MNNEQTNFDLNNFSVNMDDAPDTKKLKKRSGQKHLRSISLDYADKFRIACRSKDGILLGLVLKTLSAMNNSNSFTLETKWYKAVGLRRNRVSELLHYAQEAGLIRYHFKRGCKWTINLFVEDT